MSVAASVERSDHGTPRRSQRPSSAVPNKALVAAGEPSMSAAQWDLSIQDARPLLPLASFFIGDLRDGLPMLNMQAAYLISEKRFSEKQVGLLFLVFGLSQFIAMIPAGYFLDYSNRKIDWVIYCSLVISVITVAGPLTAQEGGENIAYLIIWRVVQGGLSSVLPCGFNGITLGIVGTKGFTYQVSRNRMMHHLGTALVVAVGSLLAYFLYPDLEYLFSVSPLAAFGVTYYLSRIRPDHVHRDAARGLILESPTMEEYELADDLAACKQEAANILQLEAKQTVNLQSELATFNRQTSSHSSSRSNYRPPALSSWLEQSMSKDSHPHPEPPLLSPSLVDARSTQRLVNPLMPQRSSDDSVPSYNMGWSDQANNPEQSGPRTPWAVLVKPELSIFTFVIFLFHLANSSVLPLVMQSLALQTAQFGILLSGLCILIAQAFMSVFAKLCGDYSPYWGRKRLFLVGLISLTIRCVCLAGLEALKDTVDTERGSFILRILFLATQILDSVSSGIVGTMHILVTCDISGGTGRFSLILGVTMAAMCLGATVSGYLGQALAQDYGYPHAFAALGGLSILPFILYYFFMPETLPEDARPRKPRKRQVSELIQRFQEHKRRLLEASTRPFRRMSLSSRSSVDSATIATTTGHLV
jgi:MFS family permease